MSFIDRQTAGAAVRRLAVMLFFLSECCLSAGEQQFGRLFTTPEQRQWLQMLREQHRKDTQVDQQRTADRSSPDEGRTQAPRAPDSPVITLKGLIYKEDGTRMAWIDAQGELATLDYRQAGRAGASTDDIVVPVGAGGKSVRLKPGQSYHPESGAVTELRDAAP